MAPTAMSPSSTTAYPATGRRRRAMIQLNGALVFWSVLLWLGRWAAALPDISAQRPSVDEVDRGEQADPHDIHEVPVVGDNDRADLLLVSEGLGHVGAAQHEQERDEPAGHVQAVDPGGDEENGAVPAGRRTRRAGRSHWTAAGPWC